MGILKRYKAAQKDKSLKSLIWFDKWLLICFGFPEIRDIQEEVEWLRGALIHDEDGSDTEGESEMDEEDSEDEQFENEMVDAEDDAPDVDVDDDDQEMDVQEDEMAENNKDFEEMEQGYFEGGTSIIQETVRHKSYLEEAKIEDEENGPNDEQPDSIVDSEIAEIEDHINDDGEYDLISGKSSFTILGNTGKPASTS